MSDILIKDMEMPKNCESCPCKTADVFGGLGCQATGYIPLRKANQDRPDNCPLVFVPPHGDLIDRDALMKGEGRYIISFGKEGIDVAEINRAPTIIPADDQKEE